MREIIDDTGGDGLGCFSCGQERTCEPIVNNETGRPGVWYCRRCCVWTLAYGEPIGPAQGDLFASDAQMIAEIGIVFG